MGGCSSSKCRRIFVLLTISTSRSRICTPSSTSPATCDLSRFDWKRISTVPWMLPFCLTLPFDNISSLPCRKNRSHGQDTSTKSAGRTHAPSGSSSSDIGKNWDPATPSLLVRIFWLLGALCAMHTFSTEWSCPKRLRLTTAPSNTRKEHLYMKFQPTKTRKTRTLEQETTSLEDWKSEMHHSLIPTCANDGTTFVEILRQFQRIWLLPIGNFMLIVLWRPLQRLHRISRCLLSILCVLCSVGSGWGALGDANHMKQWMAQWTCRASFSSFLVSRTLPSGIFIALCDRTWFIFRTNLEFGHRTFLSDDVLICFPSRNLQSVILWPFLPIAKNCLLRSIAGRHSPSTRTAQTIHYNVHVIFEFLKNWKSRSWNSTPKAFSLFEPCLQKHCLPGTCRFHNSVVPLKVPRRFQPI